MTTMKFRIPAIATALAGVIAAATQAGAVFTCDVVSDSHVPPHLAKQGALDPDSQTLGARFADQLDCNDSGDCVFVAQPLGARDKLYLYPSAGDAEVVAKANGVLPPLFRSSNVFRFWSLNNGKDVAFRGELVGGVGVFKKPSGGALQTCAKNGDPAPNGSVFKTFPHVAQINLGGKVAFVADRDAGPRCAYICDCPDACTAKVCVGDDTDDGGGGMNEICQIFLVGLGDTGTLALSASIASSGNCSGAQQDAILFKKDGMDALEIAVEGKDCPTPPGGKYIDFAGAGPNETTDGVAPLVNAADKVGFQATCNPTSNLHTTGIFLWEPPTKAIALKGDGAPLPGGGTIGNLRRFQTSDADQAIFRTTVGGNMDDPRARFCIFRFDATDEKVVCNNDAPPFGVKYINIRDPGASSDGDQVCARVRIKDDNTAMGFVPPLVKTAVIRCHP